jgi:energy-coupling factor transport system permease protein
MVNLYSPRNTTFHRLHPLTKLTLGTSFALSGAVIGGAWPTYVFFIMLVMPIAIWGKVAVQLLRALLPIALPFAISLFVIRGLLWPAGTPLFFIGPLSIKLEGLTFAAAALGRVLLIMSGFILLSLTTRPDELLLALTERGFPPMIAYVIVTTIQIVPQFQARALTILDAQQSRGMETEGPIWLRVKALLPLVVPLVLSSIVDMQERAIALEARAFRRIGPKTSLLVLHDTGGQKIARWLILLVPLALIVMRLILGIDL